MMPRWLVYLVCLCCLPILASCSRSEQRNSSQTGKSRSSAGALPTDLTIVFGEGGGFTGLWEGYTIQPDGNVLHWRGPVAEQDPQQVGRLSETDRRDLWAKIRQQDFFAQESREPGELTRFFRVTADGKTHQIQWVPQIGTAQDTFVPAELYGHCRKIMVAM
ncbi:MAG: hypothetical protein KAY24_19410 [Candidatus Eisenbacteria sp.]|nr:hypothetical protein [Candidatus Eisenbacteria bacterium]